MASRTQTISIPLEEYKELLLRERPSEREKWLFAGFVEVLQEGLTYTEQTERDRWYTNVVGPHMKVEKADDLVHELLRLIKYRDRELYMRLVNGVMTAERERKANEERVKQMNEAKEIRAQLKEEE